MKYNVFLNGDGKVGTAEAETEAAAIEIVREQIKSQRDKRNFWAEVEGAKPVATPKGK